MAINPEHFAYLNTLNTSGEQAAQAEVTERLTATAKESLSNQPDGAAKDRFVAAIVKEELTKWKNSYNETVESLRWNRAKKAEK